MQLLLINNLSLLLSCLIVWNGHGECVKVLLGEISSFSYPLFICYFFVFPLRLGNNQLLFLSIAPPSWSPHAFHLPSTISINQPLLTFCFFLLSYILPFLSLFYLLQFPFSCTQSVPLSPIPSPFPPSSLLANGFHGVSSEGVKGPSFNLVTVKGEMKSY